MKSRGSQSFRFEKEMPDSGITTSIGRAQIVLDEVLPLSGCSS